MVRVKTLLTIHLCTKRKENKTIEQWKIRVLTRKDARRWVFLSLWKLIVELWGFSIRPCMVPTVAISYFHQVPKALRTNKAKCDGVIFSANIVRLRCHADWNWISFLVLFFMLVSSGLHAAKAYCCSPHATNRSLDNPLLFHSTRNLITFIFHEISSHP